VGGRRYIVGRNDEEARKDVEARAKLLDGLQRKRAAGAKILVANTGYRCFLAAPGADGFAIDPAKVEADAQFDGIFALPTRNDKGNTLPRGAGWRLRVVVESATRLAAIPAGLDILHQQRAGAVFAVGQAFVQHLHD
jgi:hypothetical protein